MPIPFPHYACIKDHYCCFYVGSAPEYVVILRLLRPQIEFQMPGLKLHIGCRDEFRFLLDGDSNCVFSSEIEKKKIEYAYIRELRNDNFKHTLLSFMEESGLKISPISLESTTNKGLCLICPEGINPTKAINAISIEMATQKVKNLGYSPLVLGSDINASLDLKIRPSGKDKLSYIKEASWVLGVENEYTYLAASQGIRTTLVATGVGTNLFKQLFPKAEIIESVQN